MNAGVSNKEIVQRNVTFLLYSEFICRILVHLLIPRFSNAFANFSKQMNLLKAEKESDVDDIIETIKHKIGSSSAFKLMFNRENEEILRKQILQRI